jgi:hypothetical protein
MMLLLVLFSKHHTSLRGTVPLIVLQEQQPYIPLIVLLLLIFILLVAGLRIRRSDQISSDPVPLPGVDLMVSGTGIQTDIKVYPNPTNNFINVVGLNNGDRLTLYDMMGTELQLSNSTSAGSVSTCSMLEIPSGNYILYVRDINGYTRSRVRVQKK